MIPWHIVLLGWFIAAQAQPVPVGYQQVAREYGLPPALLYAVALTESGQNSLSEGQFRPWPWALNINGEGRYFRSRQGAWQALQAVLATADSSVDSSVNSSVNTSVDIGLMQINWRYHRAVLGSTWQALDPYHNLRVAAVILRDCHAVHGHWLASVGCYHAPNHPANAHAYARRVKQHWATLADAQREVGFERP